MGDSTTNSDINYHNNFNVNSNLQAGSVDAENNSATNENDTANNNLLNRNNFTTRDHLFQAMFSRIALTYDRTFPPFVRQFIEFILLLTAISVLFILIYIHMAFVKAPITCLDHFAFNENTVTELSSSSNGDASTFKHMVIRVEVLHSPPPKYSLYHSYSKEYDDNIAGSGVDDGDTSSSRASLMMASSKNPGRLTLFSNLVGARCDKIRPLQRHTEHDRGDHGEDLDKEPPPRKSAATDDGSRTGQTRSENWLHRLFDFPINPILEQAEYWREKLSVRAMAPFRHTFNELELFAKSVFTEEKYIMEYSLEYGLLRLTPQTRERLNIPVHFVLLDANKDQCFGNGVSRFLLQEFVGYDQIIIGSLKRLAERQNGKGYVRNVVSGEHYRFVNSWMSRTSYLAAGFIMIIFTLSVSMLLRYSHHQIFVFIVDLLRMLENNLQFSFPAAPLLTVVLALVGMEAIMSEFFNDTSTAFYTILIIWLADQYEAVCCRTFISKRHWPKYFYLYHFSFYAYHYRFNGQFSGLALLCSWLFIQHSMFFFFHHYELPRLIHGIAVRAIMDSLVVDRNHRGSISGSAAASVTPLPIDDEDDDRVSDADSFDPDEDPLGASSSGCAGVSPTPASGEPCYSHQPRRNDKGHEVDENSPQSEGEQLSMCPLSFSAISRDEHRNGLANCHLASTSVVAASVIMAATVTEPLRRSFIAPCTDLAASIPPITDQVFSHSSQESRTIVEPSGLATEGCLNSVLRSQDSQE